MWNKIISCVKAVNCTHYMYIKKIVAFHLPGPSREKSLDDFPLKKNLVETKHKCIISYLKCVVVGITARLLFKQLLCLCDASILYMTFLLNTCKYNVADRYMLGSTIVAAGISTFENS